MFWRPALAFVLLAAFLVTLAMPAPPAAAALQVPEVSAQGVYAYDLSTGIELFAKDEHERMSIGSTVNQWSASVV